MLPVPPYCTLLTANAARAVSVVAVEPSTLPVTSVLDRVLASTVRLLAVTRLP